jgi:branched-chain amino acid transport system permease protein
VRRWLVLVAVAALVGALPFAVNPYQLDFLIFLLINIILVASYRFVTITGEWSLIHVVMMGAGGYTSALVVKQLELPFWLALPLSGASAALLAFLLSFPLFRMKGFYFLIGSFAAGEVIRQTWKWNELRELFGGPKGIKLIPRPVVDIPGLPWLSLNDPVVYYFMTALLVAASLWVLHRIETSRIGLTLHAIHWKDVLAESVGVDTWRYRTLAFVIGSFFAGLAGSLLAHYVGAINPERFSLAIMLYVLLWTIVGGTGTFVGPIIGVVVLSIVDEVFRSLEEWRPAIYGVLLILTVRFLPKGLESLGGRLTDLWARIQGATAPAQRGAGGP